MVQIATPVVVEKETKQEALPMPTSPPLFIEPESKQGMKSNISTSSTIGSASKTLLDGVNAVMRPGRLTAVMGGSGSGKTSFLNLLAGRLLSNGGNELYRSEGEILYNGKRPTASHLRQAIGYVEQQDALLVSESLLS